MKTILRKSDGAQMKILLLEDDDGDARAFERGFAQAGIEVPIRRAINGIEGLRILREEAAAAAPGEPPYLIVTDLNMPQMDGLQFLKELRRDERLAASTVFMLTTSRSPSDIELAYMRHVAGYICKRSSGDDFIGLIELMDSFWQIVEPPAQGGTLCPPP